MSPSFKQVEVVVTRTLIEYSLLIHLNIITKEDGPICELYDKELTVKHITLESPKFNSYKQIFINSQTMQQALGEENSKKYLQFFHKLGLAKSL